MNLFCSPSWNKKCKLLRAQLKTDSVCKLSHRGAVWGYLRRFCFTCLLIFVCCTSPCSSTILSWIYFFWITHNFLFYTAKNSLQFCQMTKDLYFKWLNVTYQQRNSPLFWGHAKGKLGWPVSLQSARKRGWYYGMWMDCLLPLNRWYVGCSPFFLQNSVMVSLQEVIILEKTHAERSLVTPSLCY